MAIYRATVSYARGYALGEATGFTVDAAEPAAADGWPRCPPVFDVIVGASLGARHVR